MAASTSTRRPTCYCCKSPEVRRVCGGYCCAACMACVPARERFSPACPRRLAAEPAPPPPVEAVPPPPEPAPAPSAPAVTAGAPASPAAARKKRSGRRSISLKGTTYARLAAWCAAHDRAASNLLEELVELHLKGQEGAGRTSPTHATPLPACASEQSADRSAAARPGVERAIAARPAAARPAAARSAAARSAAARPALRSRAPIAPPPPAPTSSAPSPAPPSPPAQPLPGLQPGERSSSTSRRFAEMPPYLRRIRDAAALVGARAASPPLAQLLTPPGLRRSICRRGPRPT